MAGFDENIVREYFELNGFFVRQLRKYLVQSRKKRADEEIDLVVYNPQRARRWSARRLSTFLRRYGQDSPRYRRGQSVAYLTFHPSDAQEQFPGL